jgi:hypothetical protein
MAALLLLLGIAQPALAGVFCVNTAVGLQNSLTTAASNGVDDEVRIVQGTYVGNFVYASTQANKLSVLGGYTTGCAGRVLDPANTILDGNQVNRVLVLSAPDVAADLLVEGLTLRNGKPTSGGGGGLLAKVGTDGAVAVNRNRIENNTASGYEGGGGASIGATTATLTNNSIAGNTGAGASISATTATLTNNSIAGNTGAGASISATTATLTNNSITDNMGSGASISATTATLTNNSITDNMGSGASISATTATLTNNSITDNMGSGASLSGDTINLSNNSITGNTANVGGGAYISGGGTVTLTNNNITGNTASNGGGAIPWGGGALIFATTATLTNNSIAGNIADLFVKTT